MMKFMKATVALVFLMAMFFAVGCTPENKDTDVKVTTYTPQDITSTTAVCGGDVSVPQGLTLSQLGVCWSESSNPTVADSHLYTTNWSEPYVCTLSGLAPGTTYHVRAYALNGLEYFYGEDKSFITENSDEGDDGLNGHDYVDLGLPSGTLWATCNVGANAPEEYGDYFAWGETEPKTNYDWSTYQYGNGDHRQLTKYCSDAGYGYELFTDSLTVLMPEDDAATTNWGNGWHIPSLEQYKELLQNTTNTWITQNGVNGRLFTAPNGNSLFLPASGFYNREELRGIGLYGSYWTSSLNTSYPCSAWIFAFNEDDCHKPMDCRDSWSGRFYGRSVRAVCSPRLN